MHSSCCVVAQALYPTTNANLNMILFAWLVLLTTAKIDSQKTPFQAVPANFDNQVDVSFLIEYWGGGNRKADHAAVTLKMMNRLRTCATQHGVSFEILLNTDSRRFRRGDLNLFLPQLQESDFVFAMPDLGETRVYNNLARFSRFDPPPILTCFFCELSPPQTIGCRGKYLFFTQDDVSCEHPVRLVMCCV